MVRDAARAQKGVATNGTDVRSAQIAAGSGIVSLLLVAVVVLMVWKP